MHADGRRCREELPVAGVGRHQHMLFPLVVVVVVIVAVVVCRKRAGLMAERNAGIVLLAGISIWAIPVGTVIR